MRVLKGLIFFSFGLVDDQKSFNAVCNNIFLHFSAAIMNFFIILKCSVFFLLRTLSEEFLPVKYYLCWICTSNKNNNIKNHKIQFFSHFVEFTVKQVLKSFSDRNNSLELHVFEFSNSLPYFLEESRKL